MYIYIQSPGSIVVVVRIVVATSIFISIITIVIVITIITTILVIKIVVISSRITYCNIIVCPALCLPPGGGGMFRCFVVSEVFCLVPSRELGNGSL